MNIGPRMGPRMMIAGPASRNMPTMNSRILIRNNRISGFSLRLRIKAASVSGVWLRLTTVLKAIAAPTSNNTTLEVRAAFLRIAGSSVIRSVRSTNKPITRAYRTATAAASVGVKTPNRMPPRIITGVINGKKARVKALAFWRQVVRTDATGKLCLLARKPTIIIKPTPTSTPGTMPARNKAATLSPMT